jgi:hypothetical protein
VSTDENWYVDISKSSNEDIIAANGIMYQSANNYATFPTATACTNIWWTPGNQAWVSVVCIVPVLSLIVAYIMLNCVVKRRRDRGQNVWPICFSITCISRVKPDSSDDTPAEPSVTFMADTPSQHIPYAHHHAQPVHYMSSPMNHAAPPAFNPTYIPPTAEAISFEGGDNVMLDPVTGMFIVQPSSMEKSPQYDPISGKWA